MIVPQQWTRIKEIVDDALQCDPRRRAGLLDQACPADADEELREEVESLIAAYDAAAPFSGVAPFPGRRSLFREDDDDREVDEALDVIGPYRLERELGAGGMGRVWLAEQTHPVQRWVAVKVIRGNFRHREQDPEIARRFLYERQSLASMNHPAIAKVFDAGTTASGQLYLAMQYVDGCNIIEYCDRHRLTIGERLRLFTQVCDGVQHAHQKAIIHRDLKPSNILVTEVDGRPVPQIIDFGVAKSVAGTSDSPAGFTRAGRS